MQNHNISILNPEKLRRANAKFVEHYADWASHMLTLTFRNDEKYSNPSQSQIDRLLRHLRVDLNYDVWKKRTKYNAKAKILFIPIVEGLNGNKQVHIHVLLGNIKEVLQLNMFVAQYVTRWPWLGYKYDIKDIYAADGLCWYLTKETHSINTDAVRWEHSLIPSALIPKQHTLLYA